MVGYLCSYVCWGRKAEDTTRDDSMTPYEPYKEADDTGEDGGMTPEEVVDALTPEEGVDELRTLTLGQWNIQSPALSFNVLEFAAYPGALVEDDMRSYEAVNSLVEMFDIEPYSDF